MAEVTHNEAGFEARMVFIEDLLQNTFGFAPGYDVKPVAYNPDVPFKSNNFIYEITLSQAQQDSSGLLKMKPHPNLQFGCQQLSRLRGEHKLILRLTNSHAEGMDNPNRVENEVSMMSLVRASMTKTGLNVIPDVYAWNSTALSSQGWILEQCMPGVDLDTVLSSMSLAEKRGVFEQIIQMLKALQDCEIPSTFVGHGGGMYNASGDLISAQMPTTSAGPWSTVETTYMDRFQKALVKTDDNHYIGGWKTDGVRERLEAFIKDGLRSRFKALVEDDRRCVVHGDLTTNNMLYDIETKQVTALLDFDFAYVSHPMFNHISTFGDDSGGSLVGYSGNDEDSEKHKEDLLRQGKLTGNFPATLTDANEESERDLLDTAKIWEEELKEAGILRPSTLPGMAEVADVDALLEGIVPWRLSNAEILKLQSEASIWGFRKEAEAKLSNMLRYQGY